MTAPKKAVKARTFLFNESALSVRPWNPKDPQFGNWAVHPSVFVLPADPQSVEAMQRIATRAIDRTFYNGGSLKECANAAFRSLGLTAKSP